MTYHNYTRLFLDYECQANPQLYSFGTLERDQPAI